MHRNGSGSVLRAYCWHFTVTCVLSGAILILNCVCFLLLYQCMYGGLMGLSWLCHINWQVLAVLPSGLQSALIGVLEVLDYFAGGHLPCKEPPPPSCQPGSTVHACCLAACNTVKSTKWVHVELPSFPFVVTYIRGYSAWSMLGKQIPG